MPVPRTPPLAIALLAVLPLGPAIPLAAGEPAPGPAASAPDRGPARARPELSADEREARDFRLDWERVEKYARALANIAMAVESSTELRARIEAAEELSAATFSDEVSKVDGRTPEAAAAIHAAGLSTREYVVMSATLIGGALAVGLKRDGAISSYPPTLSAENARFLERNYDRIQALLAPYSAAEGDSGGR